MPTVKKVPPKSAAQAKPAAKPSTSRALQPWEQEMADAAKAAAKAVQLQGLKSISTRNGIMKIDDEPVEGNALRCVVLAALPENQYFNKAYDPKKTQIPVCYAIGDPSKEKPDEGMKPHENSTEKQHPDCATCWANKMGSADVGKGKACKNVIRMVLVTEDALDSVEALNAAETRLLKVPVMSVNNWAKYVHQLESDMRRPPYGVVTEVSLEDDDKSQFRVLFAFQELVNFSQEMYEAMKSKVKSATDSLTAPYPNIEEEEEEEKPRRGPAAKKAAPVAKKAAQRGSKY